MVFSYKSDSCFSFLLLSKFFLFNTVISLVAKDLKISYLKRKILYCVFGLDLKRQMLQILSFFSTGYNNVYNTITLVQFLLYTFMSFHILILNMLYTMGFLNHYS